jgi:hypothetical protein
VPHTIKLVNVHNAKEIIHLFFRNVEKTVYLDADTKLNHILVNNVMLLSL